MYKSSSRTIQGALLASSGTLVHTGTQKENKALKNIVLIFRTMVMCNGDKGGNRPRQSYFP